MKKKFKINKKKHCLSKAEIGERLRLRKLPQAQFRVTTALTSRTPSKRQQYNQTCKVKTNWKKLRVYKQYSLLNSI